MGKTESWEKPYKTMISPPIEFGLRSIGVWPDSMFPRLYQYLWATGMVMALTFQFWYIIDRIGVDDMLDLLDCFSTSLSYIVVFFKLIFFWANRGIFHQLLTAMNEDWREDVNSEWKRRIIYRKAKLCEIYGNWIMGVDIFVAFFYGVAILIAEKANRRTIFDSSNYTKTFVLKMKFPFDSQSSPAYEIVVFSQLTHEVAMVAAGATVNALVVSLVFHISGQIDVIRKLLLSANDNRQTSLSMITSLISKHQKIIIFSQNVERLLSYVALVQFLMLTLLICCIGLRVVISLATQQEFLAVTLMKLFGYYFCKNMEAFIICYAGEYLSEKSKSIGDAAYNSLWYNMTKKECNVLLPLILRSQKRLTITIGKFTDLSLERFAYILKASASYMSVLYALY